jgi:hypothetical protein
VDPNPTWIDITPPTSTNLNAFTILKDHLPSDTFYIQPYVLRSDGIREYGDMCAIYIHPRDFGDAPAYYIAAGDTASHIISSLLYLGAVEPDEEDSILYGDASGDDTDGVDDEETFTFLPALKTYSTTYTITPPQVNNNGATANL